MALAENLSIYKDTTTLCKEFLKLGMKINKSIRFSQFKTTVDKTFEALDLIRIANSKNIKTSYRMVKKFAERTIKPRQYSNHCLMRRGICSKQFQEELRISE